MEIVAFTVTITYFRFLLITTSHVLVIVIQKIAEMAHAHGALVLVDNSIMSPVLCQPLELGAGNKYLFCQTNIIYDMNEILREPYSQNNFFRYCDALCY